MEETNISLPDIPKNLRACLRCHLIKTANQVKKPDLSLNLYKN